MHDQLFTRSYVLQDATVRTDGTGRTVEAYAAVFDTPAEIRDRDGHYTEILTPGAFTRSIENHASGARHLGVFYNHARDIYGTPDGALSIPIGVPEIVQEDDTGVFTATRYLETPLADAILTAIKAGAIRGQSFSGVFLRSKKTPGERGGLPVFRRTEVTMREYGPTVFPAYVTAKILGTRSVTTYLDHLACLDPNEIRALQLALTVS